MHSWTNTRTPSCNDNQKMPMGKTRIPVKILDLGNRLIHSGRDFQVAVVSRSSMTNKVIFPFLYSNFTETEQNLIITFQKVYDIWLPFSHCHDRG